MNEWFTPDDSQQKTPEAKVTDGLSVRKALNANNDRPLMQIDRANQWSDFSTIPGSKSPKDQAVIIE